MAASSQVMILFGCLICLLVSCCFADDCVDKVACRLYAKETCTDQQYYQWASQNCAKYCGFCHNGPSTQASGIGRFLDQSNEMKSCKDAISNCKDYGPTICNDVKFYTWTTENCKAHCNRCTIPCEDKVTKCADYGDTLCTELSYYNWVEMNCRRYCARCS